MASKTATIKAVVLGDVDDFKKGMREVEDAAEDAGDSVKRDLNDSLDNLGEGAGAAEQKFIGFADTITGTQDVMEGLRTGNVALLATGFADLAGATEALWTSFGKVIGKLWAKVTATAADTTATVSNTTATIGQRIASFAAAAAAKAQAAAQWALNAAMSANPILLVVVALAALVAGFVIAYKNVGWFRDAVDAVARFFTDTLWPLLQTVGGWIGTAFVAVWDAARVAVGWVVDRLGNLWDFVTNYVWPILQTVGGWIGDAFVAYLQAGTTAIGWVVDRLQDAWSVVTNYVWPALQTVAGWLGTYFVTQFSVARTAIGWVVDRFQDAWNKAIEIRDGITGALDTLVGFVGGLGGRIWNAASGMFDGIKDAFRSAINTVIGWWNGLSFGIPGFDPPGPGPSFPGFSVGTPNIPYLAQGGLVKGGRGGTLAMIGERRSDELVVPLDRAGRTLGNSITLNVYAPVGANARTIGREIQRNLSEFLRAGA